MDKQLEDECPLAGALAGRLRDAKNELTGQWLSRIVERVSIDPNRIFPTDDLLDHVPLLIEGVAAYIEDPAAQISVDMPVVAKARELGALRHKQGFDAYEILKEFEILGGILFNFFTKAVETITEPCEKHELMRCASRLFRAVTIVQQASMTHFMHLADEQVNEREGRLRAFNRVVSHEIKNRIGAVLGAAATIDEMPDVAPASRAKLMGIIVRNARELSHTVENVLVLSRMEKDVRQHRHVRLPAAVKEAARQVRDASQAAKVDVRISETLPDVEVNAAVVELAITNFLSNAVKYADQSKGSRFVSITSETCRTEEGKEEIVIRVQDNGLGVPPEKRDRLFERFFRAHETTSIEGTGLGLSIVRETVESQGGRAWAEHAEGGSMFAIALPLRRAEGADRRNAPANGGEPSILESSKTSG
jgi:signal transduction histidine kinase